MSLDTLFRILGEFNVGIGEFFESAAQEAVSPRDLKMLRDLNELPTDTRREVYELVASKHAQQRRVSDEKV